jgi:hypothetical protein
LRIVSITKTWRGEEFAVATLESVYDHVEKMVYVHSSRGWSGQEGENTVAPVIEKWKRESDKANKIINVYAREYDQKKQYELAWKMAGLIEHDLKMLVDTDEIWDRDEIIRALKLVKENPTARAFKSWMYTHLKSPLYQTEEYDAINPVVFVRVGEEYEGCRCGRVGPSVVLPVHVHHLCSVRKSLSLVIAKHTASSGVEGEKGVDWSKWVAEKWNAMPQAKNALPIPGYEKHWKSFKTIRTVDLPETLRQHPLVLAFQKYPTTPASMRPVPVPAKIVPEIPIETPPLPSNKTLGPSFKEPGPAIPKHWGCCIFYNDGPQLLEKSLKAMKAAGLSIIAVDGAYQEFMAVEGSTIPYSSDGCQEVAKRYAEVYIPCPAGGWVDEVTKRNAYVEKVPVGDYFWWIDADEVLRPFRGPVKLTADVYMLDIWHRGNMGRMKVSQTIRVYKKYPDLAHKYQHCRLYRLDDHVEGNLDSGLVTSAHAEINMTRPPVMDLNGARVAFDHLFHERLRKRIFDKNRFYATMKEAKYGYEK